MRTEQDYHLEEETTVWARFREPDYLNPVYSDERPDYLVWGLHIAMVLACIVVVVVLIYTARYR